MGFSLKLSFGRNTPSSMIRAPKSMRMAVIGKLTWNGLADMYARAENGEGFAPRLKEGIKIMDLPSRPQSVLNKIFNPVLSRRYQGHDPHAEGNECLALYVDTNDRGRQRELTAKLSRIFKGWPNVVVMKNAPKVAEASTPYKIF